MKRVMFGGSFDPVHIGHVSLVKTLLLEQDVGIVTVVPAKCSPFKTDKKLCENQKRLEMCRLAFEGIPNVEISDMEFEMPSPSFTVSTLNELNKRFPGDSLGLLMGGDSVMGLGRWKEYDRILQMAEIFAAVREDADLNAIKNELERLFAHYRIVNMPKLLVSSTEIRSRLAKGMSCEKFLCPKVEKYITDNRLYQD